MSWGKAAAVIPLLLIASLIIQLNRYVYYGMLVVWVLAIICWIYLGFEKAPDHWRWKPNWITAFSWWRNRIVWETWLEATRGDRHWTTLDNRPTRLFRGVMRWIYGGRIGQIPIASWTDIPIVLGLVALAAIFVPRDVLQAILGLMRRSCIRHP